MSKRDILRPNRTVRWCPLQPELPVSTAMHTLQHLGGAHRYSETLERCIWDHIQAPASLLRFSLTLPATTLTPCPPDSRSTQDFERSHGLKAKLQYTGTLGCEFMPSALEAFFIPHHHLCRKEGGICGHQGSASREDLTLDLEWSQTSKAEVTCLQGQVGEQGGPWDPRQHSPRVWTILSSPPLTAVR